MSLTDENFNLLEENQSLKNRLQELEQAETENNQLKEELGFFTNYGTEDEQVTKKSIMKIKDSNKRQQMIKENMHLFK
ncbi:hypothetical protein [Enterococcus sp. AZ177]|uniref:hypothetical protein n=1 Tax=unclassified Enterococcus TaxID=2608891 RepID=UPI003D2FF97C